MEKVLKPAGEPSPEELLKECLHSESASPASAKAREALGGVVAEVSSAAVAGALGGRHHPDYEDLAQKVMLKVWLALPGFQGNSKLKTWITRIAINAVIDHHRRKSHDALAKVKEVKADDPDSPDKFENLADKAPSLDRVRMSVHVQKKIHDAITNETVEGALLDKIYNQQLPLKPSVKALKAKYKDLTPYKAKILLASYFKELAPVDVDD